MSFLAVAGPIVGSLISGIGGRKAARASADQAERNAIYRDFQVNDTILEGQRQGAQIKSKARQTSAGIQASAAAQGLDISSGTVGALQNEVEYLSEQDIAMVKNNAMREAFGIKTNASQQIEQAKLNQKAADFSAVSGLITGGLNAYKNYKGL